MTIQESVDNFRFDAPRLKRCNHLVKPLVEYKVDGMVVEFVSAGINVFTLTNNPDNTIDIKPLYKVFPEFDDIQPWSGRGLRGLTLLHPSEGAANKIPLFTNKSRSRLFLPYKI